MNKLLTGRLLLSSHFISKFCALLVVLASSSSQAQLCEQVHLPVEIQVKDVSGLPFSMGEVQKLTQSLNQLAGSLKIQKLEIQVQKVSSKLSSFDPLENVLLLGAANFENFNPKLQVILSHEFGHAIMSQHLKLKFFGSMQTFSEALKATGRKDKKRKKQILDAYELTAPYDELFADLTTALFFKNGRIFPESLGPDRDPEAARDFTVIHSFPDWKNAKPDLAPYTNLDPTRGALWSLIQKKQIPLEKYPLILESVLAATAKHMEIRMARGETPERQSAAPTLNQEFFRLVVSELQARGL